jgi:hypothetical protein
VVLPVRLFTSSFDAMIVRSVLVFLALSVVYAMLVPLAPTARKGLQGGSQWEKNSIKEETVLFGDLDNYEVILIGSSITASIVDIPENWLNLGMATRSSIDGAELLVAANVEPKVLMVEANHFNTGSGAISAPTAWDPRTFSDSFLTKNKPSHLLLRVLGRLAGIDSGSKTSSKVTDKVNAKIYEKVLEKRQLFCSKEMPGAQLSNLSGRLESAIKILNGQGHQIIFVEVPEAFETADSTLRSQFRDRYLEMFPKKGNHWFDSFDSSEFKTRDAVHLAPASKKKFTELLVDFIDTEYF